MLRTALTTVMVAALIVSVGIGVVAAADSRVETIDVFAKVNAYAELTCLSNTLKLPDFTGQAYEQSMGSVMCALRQNSAVNLGLAFSPLTHQDGETIIGTALNVEREVPGTIGKPLIQHVSLLADPWDEAKGVPVNSGSGPWTRGTSDVMRTLGHIKSDLLVRVWGQLGEIEDQPAGDYSTQIVLTVSQ